MDHFLKKSLLLFGLMAIGLGFSRADDLVISNFGADIRSSDLLGSWISNYDSATSTITATDNGSGLAHYPTSTVWDFTGLDSLSLTASVTNDESYPNPGTDFIVSFDDGSDNGAATATFHWNSFGTNLTTITVELVRISGFDDTHVIGWSIYTEGTGSPLKATFSNLTVTASATPEPSSILLMLVGSSMVLLSQRRRRY